MSRIIFMPIVFIFLVWASVGSAESDRSMKEEWQLHARFADLRPRTIAVLPMDNLSLEPDVEKALYEEVYARLTERGYSKIDIHKVNSVMKQLGIQLAGQLDGVSLERLARELNCDAVLRGRVDQSAAIHSGTYDAMVVSCSLWLQHCGTGQILWQTEQWRSAHRQWQIDPVNMLLNFFAHEGASREKQVAYLVHEMLKTLPRGPIQIEFGDLLNKAEQIEADTIYAPN
ncbi:MAG: DUF799 family lipoprotein [Deltaproteobacteria bacterium]|nr:DUF799 family lipoprotein [Deltaproteobacteria bacterium]